MWQHVPNLITGTRLVLAVVFFTMLSFYQFEGRGDYTLLNAAFIVYLVALISDFLDGYLARRWKVEGAFGRVVDPFVDKVLVLGTFIFFAGKNFVIPATIKVHEPGFVGQTITGITPAMVVIILARELLVTSLRGSSESGGQAFGAAFSGKLKMVVQSVTILVILLYVNFYVRIREQRWIEAATVFRDFCIAATLFITILSGVLYVRRAIGLYRTGP